MSKLFCLSPGLRVLERQMRQPPGYRPRGYGMRKIRKVKCAAEKEQTYPLVPFLLVGMVISVFGLL